MTRSGCNLCGGYGSRHDPIAHDAEPTEDVRCWAMADDDNPDCVIGSARCVYPADHDGDHIYDYEAPIVTPANHWIIR